MVTTQALRERLYAHRWALLTLAILVVAAGTRLMTVGRTDFWVDEAVSTLQSRVGFGDMLAATARDNYPPLHNIVLWAMIHLFGQGELVERLPSAIAGIGTIW